MSITEFLATDDNLEGLLSELALEDVLAIDTETTGLEPFRGCNLFSISVASPTKEYYFNFNWYEELGVSQYVLSEASKHRLKALVSQPRTWVLQNAKFDLHFLAKFGLPLEGQFYDTQVGGRVLYNIHDSYSLDAMSERDLGKRKDDAVMTWLESNKCYQMVPVPGRKKQFKNYFFDQVPFEIVSRYAMKDARLTFDLWLHQQRSFEATDLAVVENEMRLIQTLYDMEKIGVQADLDFCSKASIDADLKVQEALNEWTKLVGSELVDSGEYLKPVFEGLGFTIGWTEKMEPRVDSDAMADIPHEAARIIERYRDAEKRYTTLMGIIHSADAEGVVHTNFKQAGTVTGRMSSFSPNLQNLSSDDGTEYPIRRAFVPRPGFFFVSIDYKQMEFRLLLDYANEQELIGKIMAGHDPHDATAETTGLTRRAAKTLNFGLVYGMGLKKLGKAIGVDEREARMFKQKYFDALPGVRSFLWEASDRQKLRRFTWNWFGRRYWLKEPRFSYRAPNSIIQGGCADVCKLAMNGLHRYLGPMSSRMILQVHDEILFEVAFDEANIVGLLRDAMEKAYPHRNIPLTCSVSYSLKSFHDMIEVEDLGAIDTAIGENISSAGEEGFEVAPEPMVLQSQ